MARLIPKVAIQEIGVKSERDTAKYLVDLLPNDCIVYHSYPWLKTDRNDRGNTTLREGETDFVIILPTHGMLVLEVKGGEITYDDETRQWSRILDSGRLKPIQDPFEQVRRNMHYLEDAIKRRGYQGATNLPFTYGYAVVFPDCEYRGPAPPGSEASVIFSASDLPFIDRRIMSALGQWSRREKVSPLSPDDIRKITKAISPAFDLLPVLFRKLEEQEEKLFRLTTEQRNLLNFLGSRKRACIEGVAGSGKTMLAQAQAEKFAEAGKTTLFVCYNKNLAAWIRESIPDCYSDLIVVRHFHALCSEWVRKAGMSFSPPKNGAEQFWREKAADELMDAIDMLPERFDAVIVDEGQDFYPNWWMPLEMINANGEEGSMYVFYDPRQNLYLDQVGSLPALGEPFELPTNCRNTRLIARRCAEILSVDVPTRDDAPLGEEPILVSVELGYDVKKRVERYLRTWIKDGKLEPRQVAILSPNTKARSSLKSLTSIMGILVTDDLTQWKENNGVLFSTVKGFKGLEADAVILIDVPQETQGSHFTASDYYVACSRAKHLLVVIENEGD
ncbi:nuclease-related domain-containing DEAD/DEAH box helicase [Congregibacter litoralis]|uniref:DNA 3'-5' helicase II n=1 Tax=Congregibacter litoralis KT71 TaxID=314285 RepID=A4AB30_9GAMM|nr:NERD domain-containing protein [Congregibacter litoralis]EAQ96902.1 Nuclease-related protein domain protein/Family description [Congregibacter litoralis KT71]